MSRTKILLLGGASGLLLGCSALFGGCTTPNQSAPPTSQSAAADECDVVVDLGSEGTLTVEASTSYCVAGTTLTQDTSFDAARTALPGECTTNAMVGATELACGEVTLVFAGPILRLSEIRVTPS